jgi:hypothetical protein
LDAILNFFAGRFSAKTGQKSKFTIKTKSPNVFFIFRHIFYQNESYKVLEKLGSSLHRFSKWWQIFKMAKNLVFQPYFSENYIQSFEMSVYFDQQHDPNSYFVKLA